MRLQSWVTANDQTNSSQGGAGVRERLSRKKKKSQHKGRETGVWPVQELRIQAQSCTSPLETLSFSLPSKPSWQGYRL